MKKIFSILLIPLSTIVTINVISCQKLNTNNENNKPIEHKFVPQQPPENSKWKLNERSTVSDNKWYIAIVKEKNNNNFSIIKFNFSNKNVWSIGTPYDIINEKWYIVNSFYQWQNNNEPINLPTINNNTGKIINWN